MLSSFFVVICMCLMKIYQGEILKGGKRSRICFKSSDPYTQILLYHVIGINCKQDLICLKTVYIAQNCSLIGIFFQQNLDCRAVYAFDKLTTQNSSGVHDQLKVKNWSDRLKRDSVANLYTVATGVGELSITFLSLLAPTQS